VNLEEKVGLWGKEKRLRAKEVPDCKESLSVRRIKDRGRGGRRHVRALSPEGGRVSVKKRNPKGSSL